MGDGLGGTWRGELGLMAAGPQRLRVDLTGRARWPSELAGDGGHGERAAAATGAVFDVVLEGQPTR